VKLIFGAVIDANMRDEVRITVIATGFERAGVPRRIVEPTPVERSERASQQAPIPVSQSSRDFQPRAINTEDLDIPTFLRNRSR
jgi:cell division protein FtsZ